MSLRHSKTPSVAVPARTEGAIAVMPSRIATVAVLVATDAVAMAVSIAVALGVARAFGVPFATETVLLLGALVALSPVAFAMVDLYPGIGLSEVDELRLVTSLVTSMFVVLLPAVALFAGMADVVLAVGAWIAALVTIPVSRAVVREAMSNAAWWGVPVVVLGAGRAGSKVLRRLQQDARAGLRPVAAFDDDETLRGTVIHGIRVVGPLAEAGRWAEGRVRHALVAIPSAGPSRLRGVARAHARSFPSLIVVPDVVGLGNVGAAVCSFDALMGIRLRQNLLLRRNLILKRAMDLTMLVPAALAALPLVVVAAVAIRLVNPGNPFYAQERIGRGGRPFRIWKLRTMYVDAEARLIRHLEADEVAREEWRTRYKLRHDTRILPVVGKALRISSLDELPQLWNIALGQMSFVGPRPFPAYHLDAFEEEFRELRSQVAPGLTGLWQVSSRSNSDLAIQEELDTLYIANWSPWMDVYLLARTPRAVVRGHGAV